MSLLYPRRIRVLRPRTEGGFGATSYRGNRHGDEELIAKDIPAAIQLKAQGAKPGADLPGDASGRTMWRVLIPIHALAASAIQLRDVIEDDLGNRYQIGAPYVTPMGHNHGAEKLDV